jgi:hypothetical protein
MMKRTLLVIASTIALAALPLAHRVMAEPTKAPASTTQETTVPTPNTVPTAPATDSKPATGAKPEPTPAAVSDILKSLDLTPEDPGDRRCSNQRCSFSRATQTTQGSF